MASVLASKKKNKLKKESNTNFKNIDLSARHVTKLFLFRKLQKMKKSKELASQVC